MYSAMKSTLEDQRKWKVTSKLRPGVWVKVTQIEEGPVEGRCGESSRQRGKTAKAKPFGQTLSPVCTAGQEGLEVCATWAKPGRVFMTVNSDVGAESGANS